MKRTSRELWRPRTGRRRGFTLTELLVVIAIVAVLVAIVLPMTHRARKHAAATACRSNLRQWGILLNTYITSNDGKFFYRMTFVDRWSEPEPATVWVQSWWYIFLTEFGNYRDIWLCPLARTPSANGMTGAVFRAWRSEQGAGRLPEGGWGEVKGEFLGSYGVNGWVGIARNPEEGRPNSACWSSIAAARSTAARWTTRRPRRMPTRFATTAPTSASTAIPAESTPYSWTGPCARSDSSSCGR